MTDRLIDFYTARGTDDAGRDFERLLALDDPTLERAHDYIQWLFPLTMQSTAVPGAPVLSVDAVVALRVSTVAQRRAKSALVRMLGFYGLRLDDDPEEPVIDLGSNWAQRKRVWLTRGNHNYRRLTRILRSLQLLGLTIYATALLECLTQIHREHAGLIGDAYAHWRTVTTGR